jgi:hypothetical protein
MKKCAQHRGERERERERNGEEAEKIIDLKVKI